ncbi:MAG: TetR/AcrR family transcriptional regulator [Xanthomonadaceae bacterium]|nr:TetR/AcrR family transcriptional regulator [Xanthomonadaceae bacterium]
MVTNRREQLLDTAVRLFYGKGCQATGIDSLLSEAGVAKMTLYKYFKSKDDLILAAAERMNDQHQAQVRAFLDSHGGTAKEKLLAMFDFIAEWAVKKEFSGCPFQRLAVEHPDAEHPARKAAMRYKIDQFRFFLRLACEAGVKQPERFTKRYLMLVEGAIALAYVTGDRSHFAAAREMVETMLCQPGLEPDSLSRGETSGAGLSSAATATI